MEEAILICDEKRAAVVGSGNVGEDCAFDSTGRSGPDVVLTLAGKDVFEDVTGPFAVLKLRLASEGSFDVEGNSEDTSCGEAQIPKAVEKAL